MRGRPKINAAAPFRSSLADAAFAVEERLVWGGGDRLRVLFDVVSRPFERLAFAVEEHLVWPIEERTGDWSGPARASSAAALALLAVAAGVLGLLWASGSGGGSPAPARETPVPIVKPAPIAAQAAPAPVLHGAAPRFAPEGGDAAAKSSTAAASDEPASTAGTAGTSTVAAETNPSTPSGDAVDPGPAAIEVARRFAGAFVLYEIGRTDARVRAAFDATASPKLARELLHRPPRLPANVEVPKAKVLNVVPGPRQGDTYTLSASLLRVGVTSELRIEMRRDEESRKWQVEHVLG
jgi:hypothetical protein